MTEDNNLQTISGKESVSIPLIPVRMLNEHLIMGVNSGVE